MEIIEILDTLAANNSRNFKLDFLNQHANNQTLREVVRLALDPFTQFYIRKIPQYKQIENTDISLQEAMGQLFYLSQRIYTGNEGIEHLRSILCNLPEGKAKVIERIIAKDLRCGVNVSTANDIWPGLIKEYPVMLCSGYDDKLVDKMAWPAMVQIKMDGMRFNAVVRDGKVEFKTRNGKTLDLLGNLEAEFAQMAGMNDCVFDGELLVEDNGDLDRQTGNGILNKALKGTIAPSEAAKVRATVWDYIPYAYFESGHCPTPYKARFAQLVDLPEKVRLVDSVMVNNIDEARDMFEQAYAKGLEGIILKNPNEDWQDKRVKHQIKFKGELECDMLVTGVEPGTGKNVGKIGALVCESADGVVKVSVGSGLTDAQRSQWSEKDLVGRIIAVKYNARIKNKQGAESLFLPIFIELRPDKDTADSSEVIK